MTLIEQILSVEIRSIGIIRVLVIIRRIPFQEKTVGKCDRKTWIKNI